MNKSILNKLLFGAMALFAAASFTACSDDDEPGVPVLEADVASLAFSQSGGTATFALHANLPWTVELPAGCDWITVDPMQGYGDAKVTVSVAANDFSRVGSFTFAASAETALSAAIAVQQGEMLPEVELYADDFGTQAVAEPYPSVNRYAGWAKQGKGAATVTYEGMNTRVAASAAGTNAVLFGAAPAVFRVNKITLAPPQRRMKLLFEGNYTGTVAVGSDGKHWSTLDYTMTDGVAETDFVLAEAADALYLRFEAAAEGATLNAVSLKTINGDGVHVDLAQGAEIEEPTLAPLTVKELVALALAGDSVEERSVEGYVAAIGGAAENFANSNVVLCDNNGAEQSAIVLYSSELMSIGLQVGDKVAVSLEHAEYAPYNGLREYKGLQAADVRVLSSGATIVYTTITAAQLVNECDKFMSMPVQIEQARPAAASVGKTFTTGLTFTAGGTEFAVYNRSAWEIGKTVKVADTEATIRGICSIYNTPQLIPTTAADIEAFADLTPDKPDTDTYTAVTKVADLTPGDYLLGGVGQSGALQLFIGEVTSDKHGLTVVYTYDETTGELATEDLQKAAVVTVEAVAGVENGYRFKCNGKYMVAAAAKTKNLTLVDDPGDNYWQLTDDAGVLYGMKASQVGSTAAGALLLCSKDTSKNILRTGAASTKANGLQFFRKK